jgi:hypothetical protein
VEAWPLTSGARAGLVCAVRIYRSIATPMESRALLINGGTTAIQESRQMKERARASAGHEKLHGLSDESSLPGRDQFAWMGKRDEHLTRNTITQWTGTCLLPN